MNLLRGVLQKSGDDLFFVETVPDAQKQRAELRLNPEMVSKLASRAGQEVVFGIRPEDIEEHGGDPLPGATIHASVDVTEPMGADTMLYLESGGHTLIARAKGYRHLTPGQEVQLALDMSKAHIFDGQSEESLSFEL